MNNDDVMCLIRARSSLRALGVTSHAMEMVLFAMLLRGVTFDRAVVLWARFKGRSWLSVRWELEAGRRAVGLKQSARYILDELYRRELRNEDGVFAAERGRTGIELFDGSKQAGGK